MKVAKRRRRWLSHDIDRLMNEIYYSIMTITDTYFQDKNDKRDFIAAETQKIFDLFEELSKALLVLWNVNRYETKKMNSWREQILKELSLLNRMNAQKLYQPAILTLDWDTVKKMEFLNNMSELHRYTHGKVANANMKYDDTQGALLIKLVNDALFEVVSANSILPETRKEYLKRRQHISKAITILYAMNRPMLSYINLMQYSERILYEWGEMLEKEVLLLKGLQRADGERFKNLK